MEPTRVTAAEFLREAATLLRERAEKATPGPWIVQEHDGQANVLAASVPVAMDSDEYYGYGACSPANAQYLVAVHPGVALALADWLDLMVHGVVAVGTEAALQTVDFYKALAVAEAILGRTWEP